MNKATFVFVVTCCVAVLAVTYALISINTNNVHAIPASELAEINPFEVSKNPIQTETNVSNNHLAHPPFEVIEKTDNQTSNLEYPIEQVSVPCQTSLTDNEYADWLNEFGHPLESHRIGGAVRIDFSQLLTLSIDALEGLALSGSVDAMSVLSLKYLSWSEGFEHSIIVKAHEELALPSPALPTFDEKTSKNYFDKGKDWAWEASVNGSTFALSELTLAYQKQVLQPIEQSYQRAGDQVLEELEEKNISDNKKAEFLLKKSGLSQNELENYKTKIVDYVSHLHLLNEITGIETEVAAITPYEEELAKQIVLNQSAILKRHKESRLALGYEDNLRAENNTQSCL